MSNPVSKSGGDRWFRFRLWKEQNVLPPTLTKKTLRNTNCTNVIFPPIMALFIKFHALCIRPHMLSLVNGEESPPAQGRLDNIRDGYYGPLLLNCRSGRMLKMEQITATFGKFLTSVHSVFRIISPMSLSPSYASIMYSAWKGKRFTVNKSRTEFLDVMATMMNTSLEQ